MAGITIHVDDDVQVDPLTQQAIDGKWPLSIAVQSFCGEGPARQIYQRDQICLFGGVDAFRRFANQILAALPAEVVESDESYEASAALLAQQGVA